MANAKEEAAAKKAAEEKAKAEAKAKEAEAKRKEAEKEAARKAKEAEREAAKAKLAAERAQAKAAKEKEKADAKAKREAERAEKKAKREAEKEAKRNQPRAPRPPKPWEDLQPGGKQKPPRSPSVAATTLELMKTNKGATLEEIQNAIDPSGAKHKARPLLLWMNRELGYGFVMTKSTQKIVALAPNLIVPEPKKEPAAKKSAAA